MVKESVTSRVELLLYQAIAVGLKLNPWLVVGLHEVEIVAAGVMH